MLTLKAPAKINIGLRVLEKREDGYHNIETLMQSIALYDVLRYEKDENVSLTCTDCTLKTDETNLVIRAIRAVQEFSKTSFGMKVELIKNIPSEAGLGGGSSDAAQTIYACNRLYGLNLSDENMALIAKKIGADVPFSLFGGNALCTGIGEKMKERHDIPIYHVLLLKPSFGISTKQAYSYMDSREEYRKLEYGKIHSALCAMDAIALRKYAVNDFQLYAKTLTNEIENAIHLLYQNNALLASLSGSGSCVFGLYDTQKDAQKAYLSLKDAYNQIYLTQFIQKTGKYITESI